MNGVTCFEDVKRSADYMTGAQLSACGLYRYQLWRSWGDAAQRSRPGVLFVMLNPSTADETDDDATIKKCVTFSALWGYHRMAVVNLYAYRARHPRDLGAAIRGGPDPVGEGNDGAIVAEAERAGRVVAAWGEAAGVPRAAVRERAAAVLELLAPYAIYNLGTTGSGMPNHPLMLPYKTNPVLWAEPFKAP